MPISVRFARRPGYDTLQIRITIDGKEGSPFSTLSDGRSINAVGSWDQKKQKRTDRSEAAISFNAKLDKIRSELVDICDRQRKAGVEPTPRTVQKEYQTGDKPEDAVPKEPPKPKDTLLVAYQSQIKKLESYAGTENELSKDTIDKWEYGLNYLLTYLNERKQVDLSVNQVSVGWAIEYHQWLMKKGPMAVDSATRYVRRISESLDALVQWQTLSFNPIATYKFGRGKTKDVYFLERPHLAKFWQMDNRGEAGKCIWYMAFIFLTGMDYPDMVRYLADRGRYDRPGTTKPSIEIRRSKTPKSLCKIPVWPELTALLQFIPEGEIPSADEINNYMYGVEVVTGFEHRLTCKIGRKTAGYIFLLRGYTIRAVSRILGHSSISITESHYVKVTAELVDQETEELSTGLRTRLLPE